jgi:hypothetical protein
MGGKQTEIELEQRKEDEREGKTCKVEQIRAKKKPCSVVGFGPPGSEFGSCHHQAVTLRKTISTSTVLLLLYDFLSLKNDVIVPSKRSHAKN